MTTVLRKAGNRLLTRLLPAADAGACVPERGTCCSAPRKRFDCNGICRPTTGC